MKSAVQVAVIGGGVTGCSILYHLARLGWTDIALIERSELTSGSSWHAAGGLFAVTAPNTVAAIHKYTFEMYPELEKESGQSCGFHFTGGLSLCRTRDEMDAFAVMSGAVRRLGVECEFVSPGEARDLAPVLNTAPLVGALWEKNGGHVDPAGVTQAFAGAARRLGAVIYRDCPVVETNPLPNGHWQVVTENGTMESEFVVNAAGLWGREVGALAGIELPLIPVEHHYLVTESVPQIESMAGELPQINDGEVNCYSRQEGQGLLLGAYEGTCTHWAVDGTPLDFAHELLPNDLDRIEWNLERSIEVLPCLAEVGIKKVINGPMIMSPDMGPLLGPHPELRNYFCANGVMVGFNHGAGIGKAMAEWIVEGEPSLDMSCWDVARFGPWVSKAYTKARTAYFYTHRSDRHYPYQEYAPGRPLIKPPVYDKLARANAVFGASFGLEHPLWFAPDGVQAVDKLSFRRTSWFNPVADECRAVRNDVGLFEYSAFAKFEVRGHRAERWLNTLLCNRMPARIGRTVLSPMLSAKGRLIGDFSVTRLGEQRFLLLGADVMRNAYLRHFRQHPEEGVEVLDLSERLSGLHIAGPAAQALLGKLAHDDVATCHFGFMNGRVMDIGPVPGVIVLRLSFTGELGYELYCAREQQCTLYDLLVAEGKPFSLRLAGTRALMMTRLEKSFPAWGLELSPDYTPDEAGVGRFVCLDKSDFMGRDAVLRHKAAGPREVRATFTVDADQADAVGDEAIFRDRERVGYVSSGGYGAHTAKSIALGYIRPETFQPQAEYRIEILGDRRAARLRTEALFDPRGTRMRT